MIVRCVLSLPECRAIRELDLHELMKIYLHKYDLVEIVLCELDLHELMLMEGDLHYLDLHGDHGEIELM